MKPNSFVDSISGVLAPLADAKRATEMKAYMRGQFEFLGIATPARRKVTAQLIRQEFSPKELIGSARGLWSLPQREYQYVAVDLLAGHWKTLSLTHVADLLALSQIASWWDSVDGLAGVVGDVVKAASHRDRASQRTMDAALEHGEKWVRRIAMLHQLGWRAGTDVSRLFAYALKLSPETDFFIRKAIGWALRDYARHDPEAVRAFLTLTRNQLSSLSLREASKHLGRAAF